MPDSADKPGRPGTDRRGGRSRERSGGAGRGTGERARRSGRVLSPRSRTFRALVEGTTHMVVLIDADATVIYVSPSVRILLGYEPKDLIGRSLIDIVHPDDLDAAAEGMAYEAAHPGRTELEAGDMAIPHEYRVLRADGSWTTVEVLGNNQLDDPDVAGILIVARDITDRCLTDETVDLLSNSAPLSRVLRSVAGIIERQIRGLSVGIRVEVPDGGTLLAPRGEPLLVSTLPGVLAGQPAADGPTPWELALETGEPVVAADVAADDSQIAPSVRAAAAQLGLRACWALPVPDVDGDAPIGCIVAWSTEPGEPLIGYWVALRRALRLASLAITRSRTEDRLRWAATHDPLTGVLNRAAFVERVEKVLRRHPAPVRHAVMFVDLDHFKPVNDRHGHVVGDGVLIVVARRIEAVLRQGDTVSRVGGDEFCVLCADVDQPTAEAVAARIVAAIGEPMVVDGVQAQVGASAGLAIGSGPDDTAASLLRRADSALYDVKETGRGRWQEHRSA